MSTRLQPEIEWVEREMPLDELMQRWRPGSAEWSWDEEFADLRSRQTPYLDVLATSIQETGIHMPILLGTDWRVWDGHHRVCVAYFLAIPVVPVEVPR